MKKYLLTLCFVFAIVFTVVAQTFTFTNCGQTGYTGPSQSQVNSTYGSTNTLYSQVTATAGIQYWTVPSTGIYSIEVHGAEGGYSNNYGGSGGDGSMMSGDFSLTVGTQLKILVGQEGYANTYDGGGGGGTFVTLTDNTPIIIAGGGGGGSASCSQNYQHGWINENGQSNCNGTLGGTNGSGGNNCTTAGPGAGLLGNGQGGWYGQAFVNGGNGHSNQAQGGFGGGGAGGGTNGAGGGGGYSGGAGSCWDTYAGGGGSYNSGTNQLNQTGENTGHGYVIISAPPCAYSTTDVSLAIGTTSYAWNGTTYTAGGTYSDTLTSAAGCDSVATLNLTIPTGVGVIAHSNATYNFTPTTVDSTTTIALKITNTVGTTNTVSLSGLSAPFSASTNSVVIAANDSVTINISFNPTITGSFTDTLSWTGSIYGSGSIVYNGEGVQVSIGVGTDTLTLDTVALGSSVSDDIWLFNTGTGTMVVSDITSDDSTVTVSPTTFNVAEGDSTTINVSYTPLLAGNMSATLTIYSNDPNNPTYDVSIIGNAISNISGAMCATLTAINSPYNLVGDISVPDSCTLIIEPGVTVNGNGYNLIVDGQLWAVGNSTDSIFLDGLDTIVLNNQNSSDSIDFISVNANVLNLNNANDLSFNNSTINCDINPDNFTYGELFDFESGDFPVGWYTTGPVDSNAYTHPPSIVSSNSYSGDNAIYFKSLYDQGGTADYYVYTSPIVCSSTSVDFSIWYKRERLDRNVYARFYYRLNNGGWTAFFTEGQNGYAYQSAGSWQQITQTVNVNIGDVIDFQFMADIYASTNNDYDECRFYLDRLEVGNFNLASQTREYGYKYLPK